MKIIILQSSKYVNMSVHLYLPELITLKITHSINTTLAFREFRHSSNGFTYEICLIFGEVLCNRTI